MDDETLSQRITAKWTNPDGNTVDAAIVATRHGLVVSGDAYACAKTFGGYEVVRQAQSRTGHRIACGNGPADTAAAIISQLNKTCILRMALLTAFHCCIPSLVAPNTRPAMISSRRIHSCCFATNVYS